MQTETINSESITPTYKTLEQYALDALTQINMEEASEELSRVRKNSVALQYYRGLQRGFFDTSKVGNFYCVIKFYYFTWSA